MQFDIKCFSKIDDTIHQQLVQYLKIYDYLENYDLENYIYANIILERLIKFIGVKENINVDSTYFVLLNDNSIVNVLTGLKIDCVFLHNIRLNRNCIHGGNIPFLIDKKIVLKEVFSIVLKIYNKYFFDNLVVKDEDINELVLFYSYKSFDASAIQKIKDELINNNRYIDSKIQEVMTTNNEHNKEIQELKSIVNKLLESQTESLVFDEIKNVQDYVGNVEKTHSDDYEILRAELDNILKELNNIEINKNNDNSEIESIKAKLTEIESSRYSNFSNNTGSNSIYALIRRSEILIEDKDFERARKILDESVLNMDPENAKAYLLLAVIDYKLTCEKELSLLSEPIDNNFYYKKALRFASPSYRLELEKYNNNIIDRIYSEGIEFMNSNRFDEAINTFLRIISYRDCEKMIKLCETLKEEMRLLKIYNEAIRLKEEKKYNEAVSVFLNIKEYRDSSEQIDECNKLEIEENNLEQYNEAIRLKEEKKYNEAASVFLNIKEYKDSSDQIDECNKLEIEENNLKQYNEAIRLKASKKYNKAVSIFSNIIEYRDSSEQIDECNNLAIEQKKHDNYYIARSLEKNKNFEEAIKYYNLSSGFKDSEKHLLICKYSCAYKLIRKHEYDRALLYLSQILDYKDCKELYNKCYDMKLSDMYLKAEKMLEKEDFKNAIKLFESLGNYKDCVDKMYQCKYEYAMQCKLSKEYDLAISIFSSIKEYRDSSEQIEECKKLYIEEINLNKYNNALRLKEEKKYNEAISVFEEIKDYEDSKQQIEECHDFIKTGNYEKANTLLEEKHYSEAIKLFESLGSYNDSKDKIQQCKYEFAIQYISMNYFNDFMNAIKSYNNAIHILEELKDYKDSKQQIENCHELIRSKKYDWANYFLELNQLEEALELFESLGNYKDSIDIILQCKYQNAINFKLIKQYDKAISIFEEIIDYEDSKHQIDECKDQLVFVNEMYSNAIKQVELKNYNEALNIFKKILKYNDSEKKMLECMYSLFKIAYSAGKIDIAEERLFEIIKYKKNNHIFDDLYAENQETMYKIACILQSQKKYSIARKDFHIILDYSNSAVRYDICSYEHATKLMHMHNYNAAFHILASVNFHDSKELLEKCKKHMSSKKSSSRNNKKKRNKSKNK